MDDADTKLQSLEALLEERTQPLETGPLPVSPTGRGMRTSQIPTGEFQRDRFDLRVPQGISLMTPSPSAILDTSIELSGALRADMDDDAMVQTFVTSLSALFLGRRFVVRLLPRPPVEPMAGMWATGPTLADVSERFAIEHGTLERFGFHEGEALTAGLTPVGAYLPEFHHSAKGFHVPIFVGRQLLGVLSAECFPGVEPCASDLDAVGQLTMLLGSSLVRHQNFEESAALEGQILHAGKLATLGQLAAGVVHEINNPLTSISAYGQMLHKKHADEGRDASDIERLRRIIEAADRVLRFTRDLAVYARPSTDAPSPVSARALIERSVSFCEHLLRDHGATVDILAEEPLPLIHGVEGQLHQVFINLITNACHAMPDGAGKLTLEAHARRAGHVEIRVSDNGPGVPLHLAESIFEPFFSTKGQGKGTGLGLSIVRNIVAHHEGDIRLVSHPGAGATFVVSLPAS